MTERGLPTPLAGAGAKLGGPAPPISPPRHEARFRPEFKGGLNHGS